MRDLRPHDRVVSGSPLGDVVQQHSHVEHPAIQNLVHDAAGDRRLFPQLALLDGMQDADGEESVLVHRVVVIHVELHQTDRTPEIRQEAAEHAGFVHPPERRLRILVASQDIQEDLIGLCRLTQALVDPLQGLGNPAERIRVDVEVVGLSDLEEAQQIDRLLVEVLRPFHRQAITFELEAPDPAAAAQRRQSEARATIVLGLDLGAEDTGQIAHILGHQKVALHEAFDGLRTAMRRVAHQRSNRMLQIEGQTLLVAAGLVMQPTAQGPEKLGGLLKGPGLGSGEDAFIDELVDVGDLIEELADPEERVQIA